MRVDFCVRYIISLLLSLVTTLLASPAVFPADNSNVALPTGIIQAYERPSLPINVGAVSFRSHDLSQINDGAVYDPGDELLRALNAEAIINGHELGTSPEEPDYADTVFNELEVASKFDMLHDLERNLLDEQDIVTKSNVLMKLIKDPSVQTLPIVYVEEAPISDSNNNLLTSDITKRSRYYRRYPWKRHNRNRKYFTSSSYEPELRYACTPTKEDVFKLLVNLHENRKGNHSKTVNFCNRKRPAKAIFTNIRFLG